LLIYKSKPSLWLTETLIWTQLFDSHIFLRRKSFHFPLKQKETFLVCNQAKNIVYLYYLIYNYILQPSLIHCYFIAGGFFFLMFLFLICAKPRMKLKSVSCNKWEKVPVKSTLDGGLKKVLRFVVDFSFFWHNYFFVRETLMLKKSYCVLNNKS
jgi:hypothetical protein